ncbi:hypothetical protein GCM10007879_22640 [Maritalea porphyrae]|uniref:Transposase n=1 Tax=Maritalea porphyrae TaxID=880732 RepID=A0ABQ5URV9_9HYPH|nr:hypothetical protein GCM10007879_22640 [Maritalea porphyrae]
MDTIYNILYFLFILGGQPEPKNLKNRYIPVSCIQSSARKKLDTIFGQRATWREIWVGKVAFFDQIEGFVLKKRSN